MKPRPEDERFADWVDGRLDDEARARLEAELELDPELREAAEEYRQTVDAVRVALGGGVRLRAGFSARVLERAAAGAAASADAAGVSSSRRLLPWIGSFAAAAALVVAFVWVREFARQTVPTEIPTASHDGVGDHGAMFEHRLAARPVPDPSSLGAAPAERGVEPSAVTVAAPTTPATDRSRDASKRGEGVSGDFAVAEREFAVEGGQLGQGQADQRAKTARTRQRIDRLLDDVAADSGRRAGEQVLAVGQARSDEEFDADEAKELEVYLGTLSGAPSGPRLPLAGALVYVLELPDAPVPAAGGERTEQGEGLARRAQEPAETGAAADVKPWTFYARSFVEQPLSAASSWSANSWNDNVMPPQLYALDSEASRLAFLPLKLEELQRQSNAAKATGPTGAQVTGPTGAQVTGPTGAQVTGPTGAQVTGPTGAPVPAPPTTGGAKPEAPGGGRFAARPGDVAYRLVGDPSQQEAYLRRLLTAVGAVRGRVTVQRAELVEVPDAVRGALPAGISAPESEVLLVLRQLAEKDEREK